MPDMPPIGSRLSLARVLDITEGAIRRAENEARILRAADGSWNVADVVRAWRTQTRRHRGQPLPPWLDADVALEAALLRQLACRAHREARRQRRTLEEIAADRAVERLLDELVATAAEMGRWDVQAFRVEQTSPRDHDLDADEVRAALAAVPNAGEWLQHAWYQGSDLRSVCLDEPDDETWTRRRMLADAVWWLVLLHRRTLAEAGCAARDPQLGQRLPGVESERG